MTAVISNQVITKRVFYFITLSIDPAIFMVPSSRGVLLGKISSPEGSSTGECDLGMNFAAPRLGRSANFEGRGVKFAVPRRTCGIPQF